MLVSSGIRSVSFYEHIITVGTGHGSLLFYDIRAQRFLEDPVGASCGHKGRLGEGILNLTTGKGWLVSPPLCALTQVLKFIQRERGIAVLRI